MTDDIVTQLRELVMEERALWRSPMIEAADEIERLRKELAEWRNENKYLTDIIQGYVPAETQKEIIRMKETIYELRAKLAFIENINQAIQND